MNEATDALPIGTLQATCLRKKTYPTESRAWSTIFGLRARGQDTSNLAPYHCEHCTQWHLGRRPAPVAGVAAIHDRA